MLRQPLCGCLAVCSGENLRTNIHRQVENFLAGAAINLMSSQLGRDYKEWKDILHDTYTIRWEIHSAIPGQ